MTTFASQLIDWQHQHGRHNLPWQNTKDPYRVWLSEIMLQQTQVETVIDYYLRFLAHFPCVESLAKASSEQVMAQWSGLGYYARARNLHKAAQKIMGDFGGKFPCSSAALILLPGVGRSTAAAIAAFCFGERVAILDGNVKRVLTRHFGIEGFPGERTIEQKLWTLAQSLLPEQNNGSEVATYIQAQMDLGATLCTRHRPLCLHCPVSLTCIAREQGRQAELPTPKAEKAKIPQREKSVLVLSVGSKVLLEKRPSHGIWGGLYSLPELGEAETPQALMMRRWGFTSTSPCYSLPGIRHVFTHFVLTITPLTLTLPVAPNCIHEPNLLWADLNALENVGLPAPVRRLLESEWMHPQE